MKIMVDGIECDDLVHRTEKNTSNKITIYELLGLIKDGKAPKKIKEPQGSYTETYVFDEKEQWYITKDGTTKMNIWNKERLSNEVEILEEVEDKEYEDIEELSYKYVNTYGNISQHRKSEEPLIETINALIRNQQKIIEQLENK